MQATTSSAVVISATTYNQLECSPGDVIELTLSDRLPHAQSLVHLHQPSYTLECISLWKASPLLLLHLGASGPETVSHLGRPGPPLSSGMSRTSMTLGR